MTDDDELFTHTFCNMPEDPEKLKEHLAKMKEDIEKLRDRLIGAHTVLETMDMFFQLNGEAYEFAIAIVNKILGC